MNLHIFRAPATRVSVGVSVGVSVAVSVAVAVAELRGVRSGTLGNSFYRERRQHLS
jgi:hypothetical protein